MKRKLTFAFAVLGMTASSLMFANTGAYACGHYYKCESSKDQVLQENDENCDGGADITWLDC